MLFSRMTSDVSFQQTCFGKHLDTCLALVLHCGRWPGEDWWIADGKCSWVVSDKVMFVTFTKSLTNNGNAGKQLFESERNLILNIFSKTKKEISSVKRSS